MSNNLPRNWEMHWNRKTWRIYCILMPFFQCKPTFFFLYSGYNNRMFICITLFVCHIQVYFNAPCYFESQREIIFTTDIKLQGVQGCYVMKHPNIFILFILPKKLEIPNSKKVNRNPGCTAIILHRITTLGSMPLFVHKVAPSSGQTICEAHYSFLIEIWKWRGTSCKH